MEKCFLCQKEMEYYFEKNMKMMGGGVNRYFRCPDCGLVINKTVYDMTTSEWEALNECHREYQGTEEAKGDPRWLDRLQAQSKLIVGLYALGIISPDKKAVDYGCGDGKLSDYVDSQWEKLMCGKRNSHLLAKYDKYMKPETAEDYIGLEELLPKTFDLVTTCSVFEHLRRQDEFDVILKLLSDDGIMALHTLICEEVPKDPDWFYLVPMHCTFWTNKAMSVFFERYGFKGCAYHVESRMWLFFKSLDLYKKFESVREDILGIWVLSHKFVDYWKQKPYRY